MSLVSDAVSPERRLLFPVNALPGQADVQSHLQALVHYPSVRQIGLTTPLSVKRAGSKQLIETGQAFPDKVRFFRKSDQTRPNDCEVGNVELESD